MRIQLLMPIALTVLSLISMAYADGTDDAKAIERFVGANTWVVVRADLTTIDADAIGTWADQLTDLPAVKKFGPAVRGNLDGTKADFKQWVDHFKKAGGTTTWTVVNLDEAWPTVLWVVPIPATSDPAALTALLERHKTMQVARANNVLLVASSRQIIDRTRATPPQPRPELTAALAASGDAPLKIAFIPPADGRRVVESMLPPLPNGQPASVLTHGILWASIGFQLPPKSSARVTLQSESPEAAKLLNALLTSLPSPPSGAGSIMLESLSNFAIKQAVAIVPELARAGRVKGNQLVIDLDEKAMEQVGASLVAGYERVLIARSAGNVKQMLMYCYIYSQNRKDKQFPESLQQMVDEGGVLASALTNPRSPNEKPAYVYFRPPEGANVPREQLVIYERFEQFGPGTNVGFGDGHVEWIANQQDFEKMLQTAKDAKRK